MGAAGNKVFDPLKVPDYLLNLSKILERNRFEDIDEGHGAWVLFVETDSKKILSYQER